MYRVLISILLLTFTTVSKSQTFYGYVKDTSDQWIQNVSIVLLNESKNITAFAKTDGNGYFRVNHLPISKPYLICFSRIGYESDTIMVSDFTNGRIILLKERPLTIREVKVKAPKIYNNGDTLNYIVSQYKKHQDRSIADVLSRMPGIEVLENGTILYQGRSINKFYIEGMDIAGERYSILSENLSANNVKSIQIYDNHQPIKVLKDVVFSEQAALNISLSDSVKNLWQGNVDIATGGKIEQGDKWLYDGKLSGMFFSREKQSVNIYKFNNTGNYIQHELTRLATSRDVILPTEQNILTSSTGEQAGSEGKRSLFNNSHLFTTSWLFKPQKNHDIRIQITGLFNQDIIKQEQYTLFTNISNDTLIKENSNLKNNRHEYCIELMHKINTNDIYLLNTINAFINFSKYYGISYLNGDIKHEYVKPQKRYITNSISFIHKTNKRSYSAKSNFSYVYLPEELLLSNNTKENTKMKSINWDVFTNISHLISNFNISYETGFCIKKQNLFTNNFLNISGDVFREFNVFINPQIRYNSNLFNIGLNIPLTLRYNSLNSEKRNNFTSEPTAHINFKPHPRWKYTMFYGYLWHPSDIRDINSALLFTNYYMLRKGTGKPEHRMLHSIRNSIEYKDVRYSFFANMKLSFTKSKSFIMYENDIDSITMFYQSIPVETKTHSERIHISTTLNKDINFWDTSLSFATSFDIHNYQVLINGNKIPYQSESRNFKIKLFTQPIKWLTLSGTSCYNYTKQTNKMTKQNITDGIHSFMHLIKLDITHKKWIITSLNEIIHSSDRTVSSNFFSDISMSYKERDFELGIIINNIWNNNVYKRVYISDYKKINIISKLRPTEILGKFTLFI